MGYKNIKLKKKDSDAASGLDWDWAVNLRTAAWWADPMNGAHEVCERENAKNRMSPILSGQFDGLACSDYDEDE